MSLWHHKNSSDFLHYKAADISEYWSATVHTNYSSFNVHYT